MMTKTMTNQVSLTPRPRRTHSRGLLAFFSGLNCFFLWQNPEQEETDSPRLRVRYVKSPEMLLGKEEAGKS